LLLLKEAWVQSPKSRYAAEEPLATELLPLVTELVVAGSSLDDDELVFVESAL
jgi:hypothetical protein